MVVDSVSLPTLFTTSRTKSRGRASASRVASQTALHTSERASGDSIAARWSIAVSRLCSSSRTFA